MTRLTLIAAVLAAHAAQAAPIPDALLQNLHWRSIGPYRGGRVLTVAGDPQNPNRFYFGAVNGGVWRSDDAGRTWQPIFDSAPVGSIGAIAIPDSAPNIIYVGTGEADMRSDIAQGAGMFRSEDAGRTWQEAGLADTQQIARILVDPRDPKTLLVAALGHPYAANAERGVFRSSDGGRTWSKTLFHDENTGAIDLAVQPDNPDVVYAALWQTRRPPWNVYPPSNGPGGGLYKSIDDGRTWVQLKAHGLPDDTGRIGLATSAAKPSRVYALIDAKDGGLFRSDDSGANWAHVSTDSRIRERAWYFSGITAEPKNPNAIYVCDTIVLKSTDAGAHFIPLKGDPTGDDFHVLWIDPKNPARRMLGVDQGALVSLNGGATWSSWLNQPTAQLYHVSTDNSFPYRVYGAQQDSGAASVPSRTDSPADGITMQDFREMEAGGESDNIAPDPDDPDIIYGGRVDRLDRHSGQTRNIDPTLAFPDLYRATWTLPLAFGPLDHALYFANQRIFRTADGGQHWSPISPDLTRPNPAVPPTLDAATAADAPSPAPRRGVVYSLAPSPLDKKIIWAGTDDGLVWRTNDAGLTWSNITPQGMPPWSKIGIIEASRFDPNTAYIAVDRHRLDDRAPYIYRTDNAGRFWSEISDGIGDEGLHNSVNVVREDPVQRTVLYAGTERGVFISFDRGTTWQSLQRDLPRTSVRDITVHGTDLVIATHGRGFYIMDDITQLRALAADRTAGPRLFPVAPAIRLHHADFTGTPMPKDEPLAANPPDGAIIDYALPSNYAGPVEIAIHDATGAEVAAFHSTDPAPPPDLAKAEVAPEWLPIPPRPAATPGAHRFVWALHYAKPEILQGGDPEPAGLWAPPGTYDVTLTAGGISRHVPLAIQPDPRVKLSQAGFQAEFSLARAIETARVATRTALRDAAKLRATLTAAHDTALLARVDAVAGAPFDPFATGARPRALNTLRDLASRLDHLAAAVDGADAAPTPDAETGYQQVMASLANALAGWAAIKTAATKY